MISVIIPCLNEPIDSLSRTLMALCEDIPDNTFEVIIYDDGSENYKGMPDPIRKKKGFPPKKFNQRITYIHSPKRRGVGYGFDRGVNLASGDIIVLMGADVIVDRGKWLYGVENALKNDEIGCACNVGLQPGNYNLDAEGNYYRYGARILWTMDVNDLPKLSPLRKDPDYRSIIECKWQEKKSDSPYELEAVYGAFYWCKKSFYQRMGGFDTRIDNMFHGHIYWGYLEAMLSLKARVYGGRCMMYPDIRAGHVFGRLPDYAEGVRSIRNDFKYWNCLWIAHTMLSDELRSRVLDYMSHSLNWSTAQVYVRRNWDSIMAARRRNEQEGILIQK